MSNYTKLVDYAAKDMLFHGDNNKVVKGSEVGAEFDAIAIMSATKFDTASMTANIATFLATPSSANLAAAVTDETGSGALVFATSPTLVTPLLGTPTSGTLTNCTGLPVATGISGLGASVATFLATPSSANLASAVTDETGTGALVFASAPTLTNPVVGTQAPLDNSTKAASTAYVEAAVAAGGGGGVVDPTWTTKTTTYTAAAGDALLCGTSGGAFTVTLPAAPSANDVVRIADYAGTFATNNLTIGRNALKIMGLAEDMTVSTNNVSLTLTYIDATRGWQLT